MVPAVTIRTEVTCDRLLRERLKWEGESADKPSGK